MGVLLLGLVIIAISLLTDVDDILFGIPVVIMTGFGCVIYGVMSQFGSFSDITTLLSSLGGSAVVGIAYKNALSITSRDLNS